MAIEGYADLTSVEPGSTINFFLGGEERTAYVKIQAKGPGDTWTARGRERETVALMIPERQAVPLAPWEGYGWEGDITYSFTVPDEWPSDLYRAAFFDAEEAGELLEEIMFVVRPRRGSGGATSTSTSTSTSTGNKILLHFGVFTAQAYNDAGHKSLYEFNSWGGRAHKVSFNRPYRKNKLGRPASGGIRLPTRLVAFGRSLDEACRFDCCTCIDLHHDTIGLSSYDLLILGGHVEYWSKAMRDNIERFIAGGGNVAVFSGNTCYWQVRLEDNDRTMICYKSGPETTVRDPLESCDSSQATGRWADPPVNRPQNRVLGVGFNVGEGDPAKTGAILPDSLGTYALPRSFEEHPLFEGIEGDKLALQATMTVETDFADFVEEDGHRFVTGKDGTPRNFTILASRHFERREFPAIVGSVCREGWLTMGMYIRNGIVFNAAVNNWIDNIYRGDNHDAAKLTRNVIQYLKRRRDWRSRGSGGLGGDGWLQVGRIFRFSGGGPGLLPVAMTSWRGKLYFIAPYSRDLAEDGGRQQVWSRHPYLNIEGETKRDLRDPELAGWRREIEENIHDKTYGLIDLTSTPSGLFCLQARGGHSIGARVAGADRWTELWRFASTGSRAPKSIAAIDDTLYMIDTENELWGRKQWSRAIEWESHGAAGNDVKRMTAYGRHLVALVQGKDGTWLLRRGDVRKKKATWEDMPGDAMEAIGLGVVEDTLFLAGHDGKLYCKDLLHWQSPA